MPSDLTATINADLTVGSLEESVTVSGASPTVALQSTAPTQVVAREVLDTISPRPVVSGLRPARPPRTYEQAAGLPPARCIGFGILVKSDQVLSPDARMA